MPAKILGQATPASATNTTMYTVPGGKTASFNINIVNRGSTQVAVRVAIAAAATPTTAEYIEFDTAIVQYGVLERTGLVAEAGKQVVVYASNANTSVSVYGFEE